MKRFWTDVEVVPAPGGFALALDTRPIRTQGGAPQITASRALADAMAGEWRAQGDTVDPRTFPMRDLADYAIDRVAPDPAVTIAKLLAFAETDTLLYRAEPDEPLFRRQQAVWEPLTAALEQRESVVFIRTHGILHRPQPPATLDRLRALLVRHDAFALAALQTLASLASSLTIGLAAMQAGSDPDRLWNAANLEEDWQAEQWGQDAEAQARRAGRAAEFAAAHRFAALAAER